MKAFLQISVAENNRNFLRFLWWKDYQKEELITLSHSRVVYGDKTSSFLLRATISHHLNQAPEKMRATVDKLKGSFEQV